MTHDSLTDYYLDKLHQVPDSFKTAYRAEAAAKRADAFNNNEIPDGIKWWDWQENYILGKWVEYVLTKYEIVKSRMP